MNETQFLQNEACSHQCLCYNELIDTLNLEVQPIEYGINISRDIRCWHICPIRRLFSHVFLSLTFLYSDL